VLHLHSSKAGGLGALVGRLRGVPLVVFHAHGWAFNERRPAWQKFLIRVLHATTVLLAHRTIAVAEALPRQLGFRKLLGARFSVIHGGIAEPSLLTRAEARASLSANPEVAATIEAAGGALIVAVAELHPSKGLDVLIEAAALLRDEAPSLPFGVVVLGDGEKRAELSLAIAERELGGRVALAGFVPDAPSYLAAFDIFAMPSRTEALPLALLEAGAAGLPCVASRVGGIPEVIDDGASGLLVEPEDVGQLAAALRRLAEDPSLRASLGATLAQTVRAGFSRSGMSTATVDLYRASLAERR
jgi:glycosyltransferase involved in cell wall biosynthesis